MIFTIAHLKIHTNDSIIEVLLLPFPLLRRLNSLPFSEKAGLTCIFLLGVITLSLSTGRFVLNVESVFSNSGCEWCLSIPFPWASYSDKSSCCGGIRIRFGNIGRGIARITPGPSHVVTPSIDLLPIRRRELDVERQPAKSRFDHDGAFTSQTHNTSADDRGGLHELQ